MQALTKEELRQRTKEMKRLRHVLKWSLQKIADLYGISRERVRQLIGNTGYINKKKSDDNKQG